MYYCTSNDEMEGGFPSRYGLTINEIDNDRWRGGWRVEDGLCFGEDWG